MYSVEIEEGPLFTVVVRGPGFEGRVDELTREEADKRKAELEQSSCPVLYLEGLVNE